MAKRPIEILMVEDSPTDALLTEEALLEAKVANNLHHVEDGEAALDFLRSGDEPRPDLILLDLNLPKMNGVEVLAELKKDPSLKTIPVVVLTTSEAHDDIVRSYELNCACYISKPVDFVKFSDVVKSIEDFWFTIVTLPPRD